MSKSPAKGFRAASRTIRLQPRALIGVKLAKRRVDARDIAAAIRSPDASACGGRLIDLDEVVVKGDLDLSDVCARGGGPVGPLVFRNCTFLGELNLCGVHMQRLSLEGSRFRALKASDCQVEGNFDLSRVGPLEDDPDGVCTVEADRARVDGNVILDGARLRIAPVDTSIPVDPSLPAPRALGLELSEIHGSVLVRDGAEIDGQVSLRVSHVRGNFFIRASSLTAEVGDTLNIEALRTEGRFDVSQTSIVRKASRYILAKGVTTDEPRAVNGRGASIGGGLWLSKNSSVVGTLYLIKAVINGDIWLMNSTLDGSGREALLAQRMHVDGLCVIRGCTLSSVAPAGVERAYWTIDVMDGVFSGTFELSGGAVEGNVSLCRCTFGSLSVEQCEIRGLLNLLESRCSGSIKIGSKESDAEALKLANIDLRLAEIGGELQINAAFLDDERYQTILEETEGPLSVLGDGMTVAGNVTLGGQTPTGFRMHGARIRGEMQLGFHGGNQQKDDGDKGGDKNDHEGALKFILPLLGRKDRRLRLDLADAVLERGLEVVRVLCGPPAQPVEHVREWVSEARVARVLPLTFYQDATLLIVELPGAPSLIDKPDKRDARPRLAAILAYPQAAPGRVPSPDESRENDYKLVMMTGSSKPIHELNDQQPPSLDSAEKVWAYVSFFCDNVWGGGGSFSLAQQRVAKDGYDWRVQIDKTRRMHEALIRERGLKEFKRFNNAFVTREADAWLISALLVYSGNLFRASFHLSLDGLIEMLDDQQVRELDHSARILFRNGFRIPPEEFKVDDAFSLRQPQSHDAAPPDSEDSWRDMVSGVMAGNPSVALEYPYTQAMNTPVEVDLTGAHLGLLKDDHGAAWSRDGSITLKLTGLHLDRVFYESRDGVVSDDLLNVSNKNNRNPRTGGRPPWARSWRGLDDRVRDRLHWLEQQFHGNEPKGERNKQNPSSETDKDDGYPRGYSPEPYLRFSQALARGGHLDAARRVDSESRTLQLLAVYRDTWENYKKKKDVEKEPIESTKNFMSIFLMVGEIIISLSILGYMINDNSASFVSSIKTSVFCVISLIVTFFVFSAIFRREQSLLWVGKLKSALSGLVTLFQISGARIGGSALYWCGGLLCITCDYFMSLKRAMFCTVAFYLLGVAVTSAASSANLLVLEVPPVASVAFSRDADGAPSYGVPLHDTNVAPAPPVSCDAVINVWVYPLDMMTPLSFGQKERCGFQRPELEKYVAGWNLSAPAQDAAEEAAVWVSARLIGLLKLAKPFYELLGWMVVTMLIVTATNVFRRNGGAA